MKKPLPLIIITLLMALAWGFGLTDFLSFESLQEKRHELVHFVEGYPWLSPLLFIALYATCTALSLPVGVYLTLFGGFLFSQPWSTCYVVIGATIGASLLYLAASTSLREPLKKRAGPFLNKFEKGFQDNAWSYLLFLRLIPLFPFWLINLAPAILGVSFRTFVWTTAVGIIPGTFAFAQAGTGLGAIFDSKEGLSINTLLNTDVKIAFIALGIVALFPILYKAWKKKKND